MTSDSRGPLSGLRVIDVGRFVAGPVAATLLADFGADVIKVERPGVGDDLRRLGWMHHGQSLWWSVEARNKRSITLDLRQARGGELFLKILETADVLVENFRGGTLERWGLDWPRLESANERLIVLRTSGYGQTGPYSTRPAFNTAVESLGGLRYIMGEPDRPPARPGIALGDYAGAMTGVIGILIALYERGHQGSGRGQWIDNALYESVLRLTEYTIPGYQVSGRIRERIGAESAGTVPARAYLCRDGLWVGISAANDAMFARLCEAMSREDLIDDPKLRTNTDRVENRELIDKVLESWCESLESPDLLRVLEEKGVSSAPILPADRVIVDAHVVDRGSIVTVEDPLLGPVAMPGVVPRLSRTPGKVRWPGPQIGEHNRSVYSQIIGLDDAEIDQLQRDGVI